MNVKPALWSLSVLLFWIVWPAGTPSTLATDLAGSSGCVDDTWMATSLGGAPSARWYHTAIWTGKEMIVWGGYNGSNSLNTGSRYDPATDTWRDTSTVGAPSARWYHTAVWTGTEMIVWGGAAANDGRSPLNTGGRYDPVTDTWVAISLSGAPSARWYHTAVWTGTEMIVWGGGNPLTNTGGRYNPATDTWAATNTVGAPSARWLGHTAVWTGSEMIVWGGLAGLGGRALNTGGRYNPATDTWAATSLTNAPSGRRWHTAVWTDTEMIVWGGQHSGATGSRYDPATDTWVATSLVSTPSTRILHTAIWTGTEMIVWGGADVRGLSNTGSQYDPATDTWTAISTEGAPSARQLHTAVWTGTEMIVWGGTNHMGLPNTGSHYCASGGVERKSQR